MQNRISVADRKSSGLWETIKTIVYAILIALVVRTFAYEPFNIPSGSMKPTLLIGDYLFVSKFAYGYSRYSLPLGLPLFEGRIFGRLPERGDVVVFKKPTDNKTDYIKRVIGLPGDRIQVIQGLLHINGAPVRIEPIGTFVDDDPPSYRAALLEETLPNGARHEILELTSSGPQDNTRVYEVPAGHVFAMGDNRDNSQDSRFDDVGFIPVENLVGRAEIIFFSIGSDATLLAPWRLPFEIRYGRFLNLIR